MKIELRNYNVFSEEPILSFNLKADLLVCALLSSFITYDNVTYKIISSETVIPKYNPFVAPEAYMILSVEKL